MGDNKHADNASGNKPKPAASKRPVKDEGPHPYLGPNLISNDRSIPSMTLYLEIAAVTTGGAPMLGVYVPRVMNNADPVNVILYIHGNKVVQNGLGGRVWQRDWAIDKIWSHFTFPIREQLNASGQQYVLVAPTLGPVDEAGQMKTHPDIVLDQAMVGLEWYGPTAAARVQKSPRDPDYPENTGRPRVGDVILAGHSGAGPVMLSIASSLKKYKSNLKEVWGFDTMYLQHECDWTQLAAHSGAKMYFYYNDTASRSRTVAGLTTRLDNVYVMRGDEPVIIAGKKQHVLIEHDFLVQRFFADRLRRIGDKNAEDAERRDRARQEAKGLWLPHCAH